MRKFENRVLKICVVEAGKEIFDESATNVEITDDSAGEYLVITQNQDCLKEGEILFDSDDWPHIRKAIDQLNADIVRHEKREEQ